jgi:hypothetical protein
MKRRQNRFFFRHGFQPKKFGSNAAPHTLEFHCFSSPRLEITRSSHFSVRLLPRVRDGGHDPHEVTNHTSPVSHPVLHPKFPIIWTGRAYREVGSVPRSRAPPPYPFHIDPRHTFDVGIRAFQWIPVCRPGTGTSCPLASQWFRFATLADGFLFFCQLLFSERLSVTLSYLKVSPPNFSIANLIH